MKARKCRFFRICLKTQKNPESKDVFGIAGIRGKRGIFTSPRLGLRTRFVLRAKCCVRLAWIIKCLLCKLHRRSRVIRNSCNSGRFISYENTKWHSKQSMGRKIRSRAKKFNLGLTLIILSGTRLCWYRVEFQWILTSLQQVLTFLLASSMDPKDIARPKSEITHVPSVLTKTLVLFKSRWAIGTFGSDWLLSEWR